MTHKDMNDKGLTAMVCFGSYSEGQGELVFPDLQVKLPYRPGHVVLARTGSLVHFVTPYAAANARICMVNFMHAAVCEDSTNLP